MLQAARIQVALEVLYGALKATFGPSHWPAVVNYGFTYDSNEGRRGRS